MAKNLTISQRVQTAQIPIQINVSLTWEEILNLIQKISKKIELKIAPRAGTSHLQGFNKESLELLEEVSLQDYLSQSEYQPCSKEINSYRQIIKK